MESLFKLVLKLKVLICWKQMKTGHLVEHFSLKLEAIAWPDVLQEVDDLLPAPVLLRKYSSSWFQVSCSSTSWLSTCIHNHLPTPRLRQSPLQYLRSTSLRVASGNWTPSFQYLVGITWWPNWLDGKERTARSSGNWKKIFWQFWCNDVILWSGALQLLHQITFSHNSFICEKSLTVVPHKEAVFSTSTTLPLYLSMVTTCPSRVLALMSWKAMLLPMSAPAAGRPLTVHGVPSSWKSPEPVAACCRCCSQFCPRQSRIVLERLRWGDFKTFANFASFSSDVT